MSVKGTTAQMTTPSHARIVRRAPTHVIAKTDIKGKTVQVWLFLQSVIKIVLYVCLYRAFLLMLELFYLVQTCWVKAEMLSKKRLSEVIAQSWVNSRSVSNIRASVYYQLRLRFALFCRRRFGGTGCCIVDRLYTCCHGRVLLCQVEK